MILKEFDLDLPEKDKDTRHDFRNDVRCIAAQYFSYFPEKLKTDGFWKILVECVEEEKKPELYLDVKTVKISFDYEGYSALNKHDKKATILDALYRGVMKVCIEEDWDQRIFEECRLKVIEDDYNFFWTFKKPKKNKERKLIATILCHHDIDKFTASLVITNLNGSLVYKTNLVEEVPNEFIFAYKLGDFKWISNDDIEFYNKAKQCSVRVNVSQKKTIK